MSPLQPRLRRWLAASTLGLLGGCAGPTTPVLDAAFGQAVRTIRHAQTQHPGQPPPSDATGLDGKAAAHAIERYQDSFKTPPQTFEVFSLGGAGAGP